MLFKDIVMQRYAVKKFDGKKVSEDLISELLELVRFAPSAINLQPWKIHRHRSDGKGATPSGIV